MRVMLTEAQAARLRLREGLRRQSLTFIMCFLRSFDRANRNLHTTGHVDVVWRFAMANHFSFSESFCFILFLFLLDSGCIL